MMPAIMKGRMRAYENSINLRCSVSDMAYFEDVAETHAPISGLDYSTMYVQGSGLQFTKVARLFRFDEL